MVDSTKDIGYYNIHGLVTVRVEGVLKPTGAILDKTLEYFKIPNGDPELTIVLGEYPSKDWSPRGYTVGDRILYDFDSDLTTVFRRPTGSMLSKSDVEYVIRGNIRDNRSAMTVYVPRLSKQLGYFRRVGRGLARKNFSRAMLAAVGNSATSSEEIELEAAKVRLAILETFLYYRLPFNGASMAHASLVSKNGSGLMIAGSGHIGKTTLALEMVKKGYSYMGDDLVIVGDRGQALQYAEPIRIQEQHLEIFPELAKKVTSSMGTLERFFFNRMLKSSPEQALNLMPRLPISEIVDGGALGDVCRLDSVLVVRKGVIPEPVFEEIDAETASSVLAAELFWEFEAALWRHTQYMYGRSCAKAVDFIEEEGEHHRLISRVLRDALKNSRTFRLKVPYEFPIRESTKYIDEVLRKS
ncbi:MAG TPA: hypothetical protein VFF30_19965 [Nitrososphaerales archaeon]|nr:hypothetical protein [Nitrososphaerales archaeon]